MTWLTISGADRLRTRRCVPVWQNLQVRVQPTCEETHSVPRSSSGMWTDSTSWPSRNFSSHLRVPSIDCRSTETAGRPTTNCSASAARNSLDRLLMAAKSVAPR